MFSVIVPAYNESSMIARCLRAMLADYRLNESSLAAFADPRENRSKLERLSLPHEGVPASRSSGRRPNPRDH